ncbi:MAG: guanylate kinase [Oscillospiraceae bacterium]|nr:guanylate kinase [Oscillospiraceae bacterium]HAJ66363.1 guanylate kinase [Clostridiales bacterium]
MIEKGRLIVVSGPSGAGKSTVVFKAINGRDKMCFSTSVTSRKPRPGEVDGREYFFIDAEKFEQMVRNDELLEHAVYVGNYYGTPRKFVEDKLADGDSVFLDIEVQGARQVKEKMPDAIMIFLIPPSLGELKKRLESRGTETEETIKGRLARAREEYAEADFYDYIVVNDDIDAAANELLSILTAEKCRFAARKQMLQE